MSCLVSAARNGVYVNVVDRVRAAFETEEVVRLDCTYVGASDCKKIGVKLRVRGPLLYSSWLLHFTLYYYLDLDLKLLLEGLKVGSLRQDFCII